MRSKILLSILGSAALVGGIVASPAAVGS